MRKQVSILIKRHPCPERKGGSFLVMKIPKQDIWCGEKRKPHLYAVASFLLKLCLKLFKNSILAVFISANVRRAKLVIFTLPVSQGETKIFFMCAIIPKFSRLEFHCFYFYSSSILPIGGKIKNLGKETICH